MVIVYRDITEAKNKVSKEKVETLENCEYQLIDLGEKMKYKETRETRKEEEADEESIGTIKEENENGSAGENQWTEKKQKLGHEREEFMGGTRTMKRQLGRDRVKHGGLITHRSPDRVVVHVVGGLGGGGG